MNDKLKSIITKLNPFIERLEEYAPIILITVFVSIYSLLIFRINSYISTNPSEEKVSEELKTVQRPRIDQNALDKIQELEDQNIEAQALFEEARNNPFAE